MKGILVGLILLAVVFLAVTVLGYVGPFVAVGGVVLAALVVLNPGGLGARLRQSIAWWSIPGMRRASSAAVPFAALLLAYTIPVPIGAFALVQGATHGSPASSPSPLAGVGGGAVGTPDTTSGTALPAPTAQPTVAPTDTPPVATAPPTPVPTAVPTAPPTAPPTPPPTAPPTAPPPTAPPKDLCGAPPNPWGYNFCGGGTISSPPSDFCAYFNCIPSFWDHTNGYVEECVDGTYSHSGGVRGSCSRHGGNQRALNP